MSFNGSGTYSLPAGQPVVTGTTISSTTHNTLASDLATALSTTICKDGQSTPTANIPMGGFRLTGLANATAVDDAIRVSQVQNNSATLLASVAGTNTITGSATPTPAAYASGQKFILVPANTNTGATTLNVSSLGAKNVFCGGVACVGGELVANVPAVVEYDGTQFQIVSQTAHVGVSQTTQTLTDGATVNWNALNGAIATWTIGGNRTLAAPTNLKAGGRYVLRITQDGTGGRSVTWNSVFKPARGSSTMPQPQLTANSVTSFEFESDGTNLYLINDNGWTPIQSQTASGSTSIDFTTGINASYDEYVVVISNLIPATDNTTLYVRVTENGSAWEADASDYGHGRVVASDGGATATAGAASAAQIEITGSIGNAAGESFSGEVKFWGPAGSSYKQFRADYTYYSATPTTSYGFTGGVYKGSTNAIVGVRFLMSSGNITSGTFSLFGVRK